MKTYKSLSSARSFPFRSSHSQFCALVWSGVSRVVCSIHICLLVTWAMWLLSQWILCWMWMWRFVCCCLSWFLTHETLITATTAWGSWRVHITAKLERAVLDYYGEVLLSVSPPLTVLCFYRQ